MSTREHRRCHLPVSFCLFSEATSVLIGLHVNWSAIPMGGSRPAPRVAVGHVIGVSIPSRRGRTVTMDRYSPLTLSSTSATGLRTQKHSSSCNGVRVVMLRRIRSLGLILGILGIPTIGYSQTFNDPGFASELVTSVGAFKPVGVTWAPDGRMFIWTKNGTVRVFKNGVLLSTPFIDLSSQVNTFDDRGMWGLTLHPDFANNGYVYLSYTFEGGSDPN